MRFSETPATQFLTNGVVTMCNFFQLLFYCAFRASVTAGFCVNVYTPVMTRRTNFERRGHNVSDGKSVSPEV